MFEFRAGIALRLQAALVALLLVLLFVSAVAVKSFGEFRDSFEEVSVDRLGVMLAANRLAQESESIVAQAPRLVLVESVAALNTMSLRLADQLDWLDQLIAEIANRGVDDAVVARLKARRGHLGQRLDELAQAVRARLLADSRHTVMLNDLRILRGRLDALDTGAAAYFPGQAAGVEAWLAAAGRALFAATLTLAANDRGGLDQLRDETADLLAQAEARRAALPPDVAQALEEINTDLRRLTGPEAGAFAVRSELLRRHDAVSAALQMSKSASDTMAEASAGLIAQVERLIEHRRQDTREQARDDTRVLAAGAALAVGLAVVVLLYVRGSVAQRLRRVQASVLARVRGESAELPVEGRDEIGDIGRAFAYFVSAIDTREHALRASERQLRMVIDGAPFPILVADAGDRRVMFANEEAHELMHLGPAEAQAITRPVVLDLIKGTEDRRRLAELLDRDGRLRGFEARLRYGDGRPFWALLSVTPVLFESRDCLLFTIYDVDRLKSAEARLVDLVRDLERSNADLERFAYVASHDMREPLRMVASYLGLIERRYGEHLDDDGHEFLGYAINGAQRLDRLIVDLLEFSRVGRDPAADPVDIAAMVDLARQNLSVAVEEAGAEIIVAATLPTVRGNAGDLARLFQNLIGNALRYRHPDRPPRVTVDCWRDGATWHFTVADNGIGISPAYHEKVFQIFQRLNASDRDGGSGIGLAVCRKVVDVHGGRIWVEGREGEGAIFRFTLPVMRAGAVVEPPPSSDESAEPLEQAGE